MTNDIRPLSAEEETLVRERADRSVVWAESAVPVHVSDALFHAVHDRRRLLATLVAQRARHAALVAALRLAKKQLERHHRNEHVTARTCLPCGVTRDRYAALDGEPR